MSQTEVLDKRARNENNKSLHVQPRLEKKPVRIGLDKHQEFSQKMKTTRSQSKLKEAILKDSRIKIKSKAHSVNRIKGKLKIPPKLPYLKKKVRNSHHRNLKSRMNYFNMDPGIVRNPAHFQARRSKPFIKMNQSKPLRADKLYLLGSKGNGFFHKARSQTQPNISMKMKKNYYNIGEPVSFKAKATVNEQPSDLQEHRRQLHTNFMKNIKNVQSHPNLQTDEHSESDYIKVIRVSVNGEVVPLDQIVPEHKLHSELKEQGYTSFEDNGKRGFRRRSLSRSPNNSRCSSINSKR